MRAAHTAMKASRLLAVSTAAGLLSGGLFGYPQLLDAGWSPEAALWLSVPRLRRPRPRGGRTRHCLARGQ